MKAFRAPKRYTSYVCKLTSRRPRGFSVSPLTAPLRFRPLRPPPQAPKPRLIPARGEAPQTSASLCDRPTSAEGAPYQRGAKPLERVHHDERAEGPT
jgi:hypothetical protein